jgi:predicted lysophospholipase L1 biosynthesis ABC-type transport system permease subunit
MVVVGRALLPATSHTDYDQAAWMTRDALMASLPHGLAEGDDFFEDMLLLKWKPSADVAAAQERMAAIAAPTEGVYYSAPAELPPVVNGLRALGSLPVALAAFFALLAVATVSHALVTTVGRRRADLAILRSVGFTTTNTRAAIAWQATFLAVVGVVVGVPAGILVGRALWRRLAEAFPVVYVPPLALLAVLLAAPAALAVANGLAVGPAHRATRSRPATVLRAE